MNPNPGAQGRMLAILLKEARRHSLALATGFSVIALAALPIVLLSPKRWDSSVILRVKASSVLPLLSKQGGANIGEEIGLLNETMSSRRILREILAFGRLVPAKQSPLEEQLALTKLKSRLHVDNPRPELVRIGYSDSDPGRSYQITNKLAEIYIREAKLATQQQSTEAFEFIDKQVTEYAAKLLDAHEKLLASYREERKGSASGLTARSRAGGSASKSQVELSGHALVPAVPSGSRQAEEQLKARAAQIQADRDRLLGVYTEEHPEVMRITRSLDLVKDELRRAEQDRMDREKASLNAALGESEEGMRAAPTIRGARPAQSLPLGTSPLDPGSESELRGVNQDPKVAELRRRYEAMRNMYQDLLTRREAAHVSVDLDTEERGVSVHVEEPAELPASATGFRVSQMALIGLILAVLLPAGILVAVLRLDGRIRNARELESRAKVPLLVSIPAAPPPAERKRSRRRMLLAALMVLGVFAAYVTSFVMRLKQSL
jgi:uncharacterized protein involved in exopolysaccharide biosynthesis